MIKITLKILAILGLGLTVLAPLLYLNELITLALNHRLMFTGMLMWFTTAAVIVKK